MKKFLLCTTALVSLASSVAFAVADSTESKIKLTLHGGSTVETGFISQDNNHKKPLSFSTNQSNKGIYTKSKLSLKGEGYGENGSVYGAVIKIALIPNSSNGYSGRPTRSHVYYDNELGSVDIGSNGSVTGLMGISAGDIASATGGASDGDWAIFTNINPASKSANLTRGQNQVLSDLVVQNALNTFNDTDYNGEGARKISLTSARLSGLQFGISFTPDMINGGAGLNTNTYLGTKLKFKNIISAALNYEKTFNDVYVNVAATMDNGQFSKVDGDTKLNYADQRHSLRSYSFGGIVGVSGFKAALSYGTDGKSFAPIDRSFTSNWWTAGVAFESGPLTSSLTYMHGVSGNKNEVSTNPTPLPYITTNVYSLGVDYKAVEGVKPFAEVTMVSIKGKNLTATGYGPNNKNRSTVLIIGSKFSF